MEANFKVRRYSCGAPISSKKRAHSSPISAAIGAVPGDKRWRQSEDGACSQSPHKPGLRSAPREMVESIAGFCCRGSLDALALTSRRFREACRSVERPWPTNPNCGLVKAVCSDLDRIPKEPNERYDDWEGEETAEYQRFREELGRVNPPLSTLTVLHDACGSSYMVLRNEGIHIGDGEYEVPCRLQVWSREYGLAYQEDYPYYNTKPTITPPVGEQGRQFVILPVRSNDLHFVQGVLAIEVGPSRTRGTPERGTQRTAQILRLPCWGHVETKCIGRRDETALIFMDQDESAVKSCRILLDKEGRLRLTKPVKLASDPARTGDHNTRRCRLAAFSNEKRSVVAFSYDFVDKFINVYDVERGVSISVPTPEDAGWIRDVEFSPDGKTLVVAHCTFSQDSRMLSYEYNNKASCAVSVYNFDVVQIEEMLQHPARLFPLSDKGYCSHLTFSPSGKNIAFQWYERWSYSRGFFGREQVGNFDFSLLMKDGSGDGLISFEVLNDIRGWESFVSS